MANKPKTPEELLAELEAETKTIEARKAKITEQIKVAKQQSVTEAVRKGGADLEEKYKIYMTHRQSANNKQAQIQKLQADMQADLLYVKDQYKIIRDSLVAAGAKEEYLSEFIGEPPAVKDAKAATTSGEGKKRTKAQLPDGTKKSWTELLEEHKIPHKEGNSAHREWDAAVAANPNLPKVEVVTAE